MDLGFGIGTDRRIFETYLNRRNMGLNPLNMHVWVFVVVL